MVDSETTASQNVFCSYKCFLQMKTNIIQNTTKDMPFLITFIFYHRAIVKLHKSVYDTFLELC